mgnify:FL=1
MLKKQEIGTVKKQDILGNRANKVYLALGSNLGNRIKNLELAKSLISSRETAIIKISRLYMTESWPNRKFPYFINLVILIKTKLNLKELYKKIKSIEQIVGRIKAPKNYPRVCDIDIIDFNGRCISTKCDNNQVNVPHKSMHKRNFVLLPLYELNKKWKHPIYKKNIVNLLTNLSNLDLRSINLI